MCEFVLNGLLFQLLIFGLHHILPVLLDGIYQQHAHVRIFIAFSLFLICDFSSCTDNRNPVGKCVKRTADIVVLTD